MMLWFYIIMIVNEKHDRHESSFVDWKFLMTRTDGVQLLYFFIVDINMK